MVMPAIPDLDAYADMRNGAGELWVMVREVILIDETDFRISPLISGKPLVTYLGCRIDSPK
jgi:hypothetical protein